MCTSKLLDSYSSYTLGILYPHIINFKWTSLISVAVCNAVFFLFPHANAPHSFVPWSWQATRQPTESSIGGLGNKSLTSKRHYMYQRLDGEASISCHWQQVSWQSQVIWSPGCGTDQSQDGLSTLGACLVKLCNRWNYIFEKIYRGTSVFLCGVSFISYVESQFLVRKLQRLLVTDIILYACLVCCMDQRKTTQNGLLRVLL